MYIEHCTSSPCRHIQSAIERASKERTSLIVAHRLSTIVRAEQIVVMDQVGEDGQKQKTTYGLLLILKFFKPSQDWYLFQGEVIEVGNHRELVEKGGRYAELWEHQQQEERGEKVDKEEKGDKGEMESERL